MSLLPATSSSFIILPQAGQGGYPNLPGAPYELIFSNPGDYLPPQDAALYTIPSPGSGQIRRWTGYNQANLTQESFAGRTWYRVKYNTQPFASAILSITRVGTVATVTTVAAHKFTTNTNGSHLFSITGCTQAEYNVTDAEATVTGPTTFTFVVAGTPATPATGTPVGKTYWIAGTGPVNFDMWKTLPPGSPEYRALYWHFRFVPGGTLHGDGTYENMAVGTKLGFIASARTASVANNQSIFFLRGRTGNQLISDQWSLDLHCQGLTSIGWVQPVWYPNLNAGLLAKGNQVNQVEIILTVNDVAGENGFTTDQANGTYDQWVNGTKTTHITTCMFRATTAGPGGAPLAGYDHMFQEIHVNPTWGGTSNMKTRVDDNLYSDMVAYGIPR